MRDRNSEKNERKIGRRYVERMARGGIAVWAEDPTKKPDDPPDGDASYIDYVEFSPEEALLLRDFLVEIQATLKSEIVRARLEQVKGRY
jgi:hypothetical protein